MALTQINAPYNFVPLSDTVVTPEWAHQVSHDLPFKDGISGELELTIEALSPIMVGGEQKQGTERESRASPLLQNTQVQRVSEWSICNSGF